MRIDMRKPSISTGRIPSGRSLRRHSRIECSIEQSNSRPEWSDRNLTREHDTELMGQPWRNGQDKSPGPDGKGSTERQPGPSRSRKAARKIQHKTTGNHRKRHENRHGRRTEPDAGTRGETTQRANE